MWPFVMGQPGRCVDSPYDEAVGGYCQWNNPHFTTPPGCTGPSCTGARLGVAAKEAAAEKAAASAAKKEAAKEAELEAQKKADLDKKAKAEEEEEEAKALAKMQELEGAGKKVAGGVHKFDASEVDVNGGTATADDFLDAFGF